MKYIPILFSTPMVEALIDGRKSMTRRVIKTPKNKKAVGFRINSTIDGVHKWPEAIDENECGVEGNGCNMRCPYGQVGDIIWVRETWQQRSEESVKMGFEKYYYKASWIGCTDAGWKPNIHMPKEAARIFLEITNIRAERLQDITINDAIAEGLEDGVDGRGNKYYMNYRKKDFFIGGPNAAVESFKSLWRSINGLESWEENPWVWVVEFKSIERPVNFI